MIFFFLSLNIFFTELFLVVLTLHFVRSNRKLTNIKCLETIQKDALNIIHPHLKVSLYAGNFNGYFFFNDCLLTQGKINLQFLPCQNNVTCDILVSYGSHAAFFSRINTFILILPT